MPASPEPEFAAPGASGHAAESHPRAAALAELLPALVHRLNNSLAVLGGVHELGARAGAEERELARTHLAHLGVVLARLGLFARAPAGYTRRLPVAELDQALALLLGPLAESRSVVLERAFHATGVLDVDGRFEGLVVAAACELLAHRGPESGARRRVRIVARPARDGLALALASSAGPPERGPALAALVDHARSAGWRSALRASPRALVLRIHVPAVELASGSAPAAPARRRVLLLARPGEERELVEMLLRERGFLVLAADEPPARGPFDLALVEARRADHDPALAARLARLHGVERVVRLEPNPRPESLLRELEG